MPTINNPLSFCIIIAAGIFLSAIVLVVLFAAIVAVFASGAIYFNTVRTLIKDFF